MPKMSSFYEYDALGEEEEAAEQPKATKKRKFCGGLCTRKFALKFALNCAFVGVLATILALTYNRCVWCVVGVAIASALTMNCVPLTPVIFMLSAGILIMHAIDYRSASIRVEVPLTDVIYIPTWKDVQSYVHVDKP
jgi:hypothetical protein